MGSLVIHHGDSQKTVEPGNCQHNCFMRGGAYQLLESVYE